MFVEFGELTEVKVSKSLMPQHAESRATEGVDEEGLSERRVAVVKFGEVHECREDRAITGCWWEVIGCRSTGKSEGVDDKTMRSTRQGGNVSVWGRDDQGLGEGETTTQTCRL